MANLVLAIGTPFSPLMALAPEDWPEYCKGDAKRDFNKRDGSSITYEQLRAQNGDKYGSRITPEAFQKSSKIAQGHLDRIVAELEAAKPDVVVVVADDHSELFDGSVVPVISVYRAAELANAAGDRRTAQFLDKSKEDAPRWRRAIQEVQALDPERHYPGHPAFADCLVRGLIENHVDVAVASEPKDPTKNGLGFGWGFVINRIVGRMNVPVVPVILNPRYKPGVPTPRRCYEIGQALHAAIVESPEKLRVAIIVSGGLSHLGMDEELDRSLLDAMRANDVERLSKLPREALFAGSCQLLNWVVLAGVVHQLQNRWLEYLPVYRTAAGTGIGLAFGSWA
jgi:hypothetical protein